MATIPPLLFQGTLLNQRGNAIKDANIQLWQTDLDGNYLHPLPRAANSPKSPDHSSIVSAFQYFGTDATDANGNFEFLTYRPGIYPDRPYSHFHFMVWLKDSVVGDDGEDSLPALITQFYFKDESPPFADVLQLDVTEVDPTMYKYGTYVNGTIVIDANLPLTGEDTVLPTSPAQPKGPFYPVTNFFSIGNDLTASDDTVSQTTQPTAAPETLTISPTSGLTPLIQSNNNVTPAILTASTLQPVQMPSSMDNGLTALDDSAMQATHTTAASETSTKSPTTSPNLSIQATSTAPTTAQPAQLASPSAAASDSHFHRCAVFWWMAFFLYFGASSCK